jgi:hypothetical protein
LDWQIDKVIGGMMIHMLGWFLICLPVLAISLGVWIFMGWKHALGFIIVIILACGVFFGVDLINS